MPNKANFQKSQMFITVISTMNYNEKVALDTWSKQTQSKPILLSLMAGKIALSEACGERSRTVEGPVVSSVESFILGFLTFWFPLIIGQSTIADYND